ncbi:hypothetical protein [Streptomyces sp. 5-6(2022)]|uniref:hypothetical protein n=1 Tax=Streptomyces sp. 5-6(2022) TaxID=2936510 RepID=UPI0023B8BD7B|nr:hypothetical protein [Streptomyces sp. 5-6(2022)]
MTTADRLAHEAASHVRVTPKVQCAVERYSTLSALIDRLSSRESHYMTPADWQELDAAQDERYRLHQQLAAAGQLHLVEVA